MLLRVQMLSAEPPVAVGTWLTGLICSSTHVAPLQQREVFQQVSEIKSFSPAGNPVIMNMGA